MIIKFLLLKSMSARSIEGEGSSSAKEELKQDDAINMTSEINRISFESTRHSAE